MYLRIGEKEKSLVLLERAYAEHDWALIWANVSPRLDPLRSDPRFQSVLSRMKFPPHRM